LVDSEYKGGTQLGFIAALKGNKKLALENLEIIRKREETNPDLNLSLDYAVIHAALGENDKAFEYLNKAVDEKLGAILFIKTMFPIDKLKSDPRYDQLLERMGLKP
jgi:tetratricopeptide (TPR) repeat protein